MLDRIKFFGILCAFLYVTLMFSGCTQENDVDDQSNSKYSIDTIRAILNKATTYESLYYENISYRTVTDAQSQDYTSKLWEDKTVTRIWEKGPYLKEIRDVTILYPTNYSSSVAIVQLPSGTYMFNTESNRYDLSLNSTIPQVSMDDMIDDLLTNQSLTPLGTETMEGKKVFTIQYTEERPEVLTTVKLWIWNETGLPLKLSMTTTTYETVVMDCVYTNYSFVELSDDVFTVE